MEAIERQVRRLVPDMRAHLFGSQAVGLATLASDMDVVLLSPTLYHEQAWWEIPQDNRYVRQDEVTM
jgi:DNA polymerase sigma